MIRLSRSLFILILPALLAGCATARRQVAATSQPTTTPVIERTRTRDSVDKALVDGVDFLVRSQQPNGAWGTGLETRGTEIYSMVPGSHDAYRVGTTALCVMALRESNAKGPRRPGAVEAHARGLQYLIDHGEARRDTGELMYNTWAYIFGLQALVEEVRDGSKDPKVLTAAMTQLARLEQSATYIGGWNYYDFGAHTEMASSGGTSFGTAAGLVALNEAKAVGLTPSPKMIELALNRLEMCRQPNGTFMYGADYQYAPNIPANKPRGSIGRTQPGNCALLLWNSSKVTNADAVVGLELFFREHIYLDMGRKRPFPHEAWYQTSGYYYYFDHYYAARLIERMTGGERRRYFAELAECILPHQEEDGSWWDYAMWDYHKPYGTAFAVMTLLRCR